MQVPQMIALSLLVCHTLGASLGPKFQYPDADGSSTNNYVLFDYRKGGVYEFKYELPDQARHEERNEEGEVRGSFSFLDPEGEKFDLQYLADKTGFKPTADHLPTAPEDTDDVKEARDAFKSFYDNTVKYLNALSSHEHDEAKENKDDWPLKPVQKSSQTNGVAKARDDSFRGKVSSRGRLAYKSIRKQQSAVRTNGDVEKNVVSSLKPSYEDYMRLSDDDDEEESDESDEDSEESDEDSEESDEDSEESDEDSEESDEDSEESDESDEDSEESDEDSEESDEDSEESDEESDEEDDEEDDDEEDEEAIVMSSYGSRNRVKSRGTNKYSLKSY